MPMPTKPRAFSYLAGLAAVSVTLALAACNGAESPSAATPPTGAGASADFGSDGRLSAVVDCNRCSTTYKATADTLSVGSVMACTRAYCSAGAGYDQTYTTLLTLSTSWRVQGATLELRGEAGSLAFAR